MAPFLERVRSLPRLGIGVSTEYGARAAAGALDVAALRAAHPEFAEFLEVGVEADKGLDDDAAAWVGGGGAATYHFLDVNLDDDADLDDADWVDRVRALIAQTKPAWLCGDAGLWHFGHRDRGQMLLLPPILVDDAATALARGVRRLRALTGFEVLPENPPGTAFVGDLHLLDFFQRVAERADTGLLLDVAHLAMFEHVTQRPAFDADFDFDRVVEVHVAGGAVRDVFGFSVIDDAHGAVVDDRVWQLFEHVVARAKNLKAVVFECERNPNGDVVAGFERIARTWR